MVAISLIRAQNCADDINRLFVVRAKIHRFIQNADDHHTMRQISQCCQALSPTKSGHSGIAKLGSALVDAYGAGLYLS